MEKLAMVDMEHLNLVPQLCVAFNIGKAYRSVLKLFEEAYKDGPLTTMQYGLLVHIGMLEPASSSDIRAATGHDLSTLTRTLAPLEKSGFIENLGTDAHDKRVKRYKLTVTGRKALEETLNRWLGVQQSILGNVEQSQWEQALETLKKIQAMAFEGTGETDS